MCAASNESPKLGRNVLRHWQGKRDESLRHSQYTAFVSQKGASNITQCQTRVREDH